LLSGDPKDSSKNRLPSNPPTQSDQDKGKGNQENVKVNKGKVNKGEGKKGKKGKVSKGEGSGSNDRSSDSNHDGLIPPGGGGGPNGGDNSPPGGVPPNVSNRLNILNNLRENLVYCISMLNTQIQYDRGRHKFLITHRNRPHDYVMPVDVQEPSSRLTLLTGIGWPHLPRISRFSFPNAIGFHYKHSISLFDKLVDLPNSLGLKSMSRSMFAARLAEFGVGFKSPVSNPIYMAPQMEITTIFYNPLLRSYVYIVFITLIHTGLMCTVWYKLVVGGNDPLMIPVVIDSLSIDQFNHPDLIFDGYHKKTYLYTQDIQERVLETFRNDPTFRNVADITNYNPEGEVAQTRLAGSLLGIMVCMSLTAQIMISTVGTA
jgi:hypothetical protein